jgi:hypothetical protein
MTRILGACLALTLAGMAPAMADEPVRLDDATLDTVTAGAMALAGFKFTLDPGNDPLVIDTVALGVDNTEFELNTVRAGPTGAAGTDLVGEVKTQTNPYGSVSVARFSGVVGEAGTGTVSIVPTASTSGRFSSSSGVIVPIPGENGITEYYGASWAWAFDVPTIASTR